MKDPFNSTGTLEAGEFTPYGGSPREETAQPPAPWPDDFDSNAREALEAGGYESLAAAQAATDEELDALDGVGRATIQKVRNAQ